MPPGKKDYRMGRFPNRIRAARRKAIALYYARGEKKSFVKEKGDQNEAKKSDGLTHRRKFDINPSLFSS